MPDTPLLLPEWADQEAVILAWPDRHTDWAPWLDKVRASYLSLIHIITQNNTAVVLLIRQTEVEDFLSQAKSLNRILLVPADYNDTWVRDYGFLTCRTEGGLTPVEYQFNGWGNKFDAGKDNLVNRSYLRELCKHSLLSFPLVCEGGALEIDQYGNLMSTEFCLTNPQRNGDYSIHAYQRDFQQQLGAKTVHIFKQGHLSGDDTDGHIDTLVRFTPDRGLVVQACYNDPDDSHYSGLQGLVDECRNAFPEHDIFQLPLPKVINSNGERLPASYANYLINNGQVICPVYQQPEDDHAMSVIAQAYPDFEIVPLNSRPLVEQFGSIHCISMQVPTGTLKTQVTDLFSQGVTLYER